MIPMKGMEAVHDVAPARLILAVCMHGRPLASPARRRRRRRRRLLPPGAEICRCDASSCLPSVSDSECNIIQVAWAPAVQSSARVYEDAGQGLGYQRGEFALSNFTLRVAGRRTVLGIEGGALVLGSPSAPPRWGTAHAPLN
jgi:hypothetical protein